MKEIRKEGKGDGIKSKYIPISKLNTYKTMKL